MKQFFAKKLAGNQKSLLIALLAVAIILVVLVAVDLFRKPVVTTSPEVIDNNQAEEVDMQAEYEDIVEMPQQQKDAFREEVPVNIVVPDVDTELSEEEKKEIALPTVVVPAAPGVDAKFRDFNISAENDVFVPNKIIANVGDTVHVDFTAVDKDYDIVFPSYNMMQRASAGQTKILEFQALQEGSFTYYCSSCGGPESGPKGAFIIVNP